MKQLGILENVPKFIPREQGGKNRPKKSKFHSLDRFQHAVARSIQLDDLSNLTNSKIFCSLFKGEEMGNRPPEGHTPKKANIFSDSNI
jgi:hypothetical protein